MKFSPFCLNVSRPMKKICTSTLCIGLVFAVVMISGCGKKEEPAPKEVIRPIKVMTVQGGSGSQTLTYPGQTRANKRVDLSFKVPGPLVELPVEEGQAIKKGELIARILPRDFKINLDQAQARAIEAERQYERYKELYIRRQVSKAEFDRYKASRDVAAAQLEDAQNALKDTYLRAPYDGVVAKRHVENFEEVTAKQPIVFFQDISKIEILVNVPETVMATIRKKEPAEINAQFSIAPGKKYPLEIKEFSTEADPQTQTYQIVLVMDQPEDINVLPGMTASVTGTRVEAVPSDTRMIIPAIAVMEDPQEKAFVWLLKEDTMTVHKTMITAGEITGSDNIEVLEGLKAGDKIATSGITKLQDGMKVRIWEE